MHDFIGWLRGHNEKLPLQARTQFCGLDIYSLRTSIAAVLAYLDQIDPVEAKVARSRYGCLTPWQDEPARYGHAAFHLDKSPCEDGVVAELRALLDKRLEYVRRDGESFFDATQNARVVRAAEYYYPTGSGFPCSVFAKCDQKTKLGKMASRCDHFIEM
jgi:erythromycin esterase-like protein